MGYGHERPAHVLSPFSHSGEVVIANDYHGIPISDKRIWEGSRTWYERISRFKRIPVIGQLAFYAMDEFQRIPEFYPRRDLSAPSLQTRQFYTLIKKGKWMKHLIDDLAKNPLPFMTTFMATAFAAEEFGYPGEIYTLVTDADMSRAWAPLHPKSSRIRYFAPTGRVAERLQLYGVLEKNIELTGFPLPTEAIGGIESNIVLKDLQRRICRLDPKGIFVAHTGQALTAHLGAQYCEAIKPRAEEAIELVYAVGGAGAQREIGVAIAKSLRNDIKRGRIILHLVAGTRKEVHDYFKEALLEMGLREALKLKQVQILFHENRKSYFDDFTALMRKADILWTKPSELSFYTGLGIPIIMAPTVGSQEDFNRRWITQVGGGVNQLDPRYTNEWLFDWVESGALARMAWNGFIEAPTHGAYRIADILHGRPNTVHDLPLVV